MDYPRGDAAAKFAWREITTTLLPYRYLFDYPTVRLRNYDYFFVREFSTLGLLI